MSEQKFKILVVEDEESMAKVLEEKLARAGFNVFVKTEGGEVTKFCQEEGIDLVLLDLILTKEDGFETLKKIREEESLSGIPVIVLSNLTQDSDKKEAMSLGADDYMVKANVRLSEIVERVKATLEKSKNE